MPDIRKMLEQSRVIAVVGLSARTDRPSHDVAKYLQEQGYRIVPVNPNLQEPVLGEQPYPDLDSVPYKVDIVDIFRRSEEVPDVVEAALRIDAPAVWIQLGIINADAAEKARAAGIQVVMDQCIKVEHNALLSSGAFTPRGASAVEG
jgi:predicted CoA-binding protein